MNPARFARSLAWLLPLILGAALPASAQLRTLDGYVETSFYPTDDDSTDPVDLGFSIHFANTAYSSVFINNNGNVTFDFASGVANPQSVLGGLAEQGGPVLAPFFADVDTTYTTPLTYGTGSLGGHAAFVVNWGDVAAFGQPDVRNQFQLFVVDRSDLAAGDFDFEFNYGYVNWDEGQNANNLSALVGYADGQGQSFLLAGSGTSGAFLDNGPAETALILNQLGMPFDGAAMNGRYAFQVRGGTVSVDGSVPQDPGSPGDPSPVPEPSTYGLVAALALLGLAWQRRGRTLTASAG